MIYLRKANVRDLDEIYALELNSFHKSLQTTRNALAKNLRSSSIDVLVAVDRFYDHDKIIGCVVVSYRAKSPAGYIHSIAVDAHWRKQGIGKKLHDIAVTYAYARGKTEVQSDVSIDNLPMIALNEKMNYRVMKIQRDYYGKGKHAYRYVNN